MSPEKKIWIYYNVSTLVPTGRVKWQARGTRKERTTLKSRTDKRHWKRFLLSDCSVVEKEKTLLVHRPTNIAMPSFRGTASFKKLISPNQANTHSEKRDITSLWELSRSRILFFPKTYYIPLWAYRGNTGFLTVLIKCVIFLLKPLSTPNVLIGRYVHKSIASFFITLQWTATRGQITHISTFMLTEWVKITGNENTIP